MEDSFYEKFCRLDPADNNEIYYALYQQLYQHSLLLSKRLHQTHAREHQLFKHLDQLNARAGEFRDFEGVCGKDRKRKTRRVNEQLQKNHECPANRCSNRYGSYSSLRLHLKRKHPDLYQAKRKGSFEEGSCSNEMLST